MTREVVVVAGVRTAVGDFGGSLKDFSPTQLGAMVVKEVVARAGVSADQVGHVVFGHVVNSEPRDMYLSRVAAIEGGLDKSTPALTLNRLCGSGLQAIVTAAQSIMLGDADVAIGGGAESMSKAPYILPAARWGARMGDMKGIDMMVGALHDPFHVIHMGVTAENVAKASSISREMQDTLAAASQAKAAAAQDAGKFADEIVGVNLPQKKGDPIVFNTDEFINRKTTSEVLSGLRPAFDKAGSVTAGNASGLNDGAAAVVVMSADKAKELGLTPLARITSFATSGLDPALMGLGPVSASKKALERAGWSAQDVDLFELNEAFAAQACAVNQELGLDSSKVNVNGGAIALGHPIGASGCRILVSLLHEMKRRDAKKGLAALCIGGGMGVALTVERI